MTAQGKITAKAIAERPMGTVRILITDDPHGRQPTADTTGPWYPAYNKRGMTVATVTGREYASGSRRHKVYLTTDVGEVNGLAPHQTFWLAPDDAPAATAGKTLGEMTPAERDQAVRRAAARLQDELTRNAPAIGAALDAADAAPAPAVVEEPAGLTFQHQASDNGGTVWRTVATGLDAADVTAIRERNIRGEGIAWRVMPETDDERTLRIAAAEAALEGARQRLADNFERSPGGSSRRKQFGRRIDAQLKRGGQLSATVQRLERELAAMRRQVDAPAPVELDLSRLPYAKAIRTATGWYRVLKVNAKSVVVEVPPGWDNRFPLKRILEIREHADAPAPAAVEPAATVEAVPAPFVSRWALLAPAGK